MWRQFLCLCDSSSGPFGKWEYVGSWMMVVGNEVRGWSWEWRAKNNKHVFVNNPDKCWWYFGPWHGSSQVVRLSMYLESIPCRMNVGCKGRREEEWREGWLPRFWFNVLSIAKMQETLKENFFGSLFVEMGLELRASLLLGRCSTTWAMTPPLLG
jgi:hypothetical protein